MEEHIHLKLNYPKNKREWLRRFGTNAFYAGKHYVQRKKDAEEIHNWFQWKLVQAKVPRRPYQCPVQITFFWDDGLDVDNHSILEKMIVDAMKKWVIFDDNPKWVVARHSYNVPNGGKIDITITPVKEVV